MRKLTYGMACRRTATSPRPAYLVVTAPILVGGGTPFFTTLDSRVNLTLVETRTFPEGVVLARYETKR